MDRNLDIFSDTNTDITVETHRSGHFTFQIGLDMERILPLIHRVEDAHARFVSVPMLPQIAQSLQKSVVVSSVFGTNTIEGGTLSEHEIEELFEKTPPSQTAKEEKERRVLNIRNAYDYADQIAKDLVSQDILFEGEQGVPIDISEELVKRIHHLITDGLTHSRNIPGHYRNKQRGFVTRVGDSEHGGSYTPPKCLDDISMLMAHYVSWINSEPLKAQHPLIRAPLAHYYFERIHPFWDGNGRVGRVLEAILLKCSGMMYAPFGLASSYLEHIDEYFTVFNTSRKAEINKTPFPNTHFVEFFLHRLREVFNSLHDQVNQLIGLILYENRLNYLLQEKDINSRQYTIINTMLSKGLEYTLNELQRQPWYRALYADLTNRTRDRDMHKLIDLELVTISKEKKLHLAIP